MTERVLILGHALNTGKQEICTGGQYPREKLQNSERQLAYINACFMYYGLNQDKLK